MEIPSIECFDKVLCASDDENPDVKKTMYNWWRAFFEVLGKVVGNMPKDRSAEFTEKMDALMAEIMKSGDKEASNKEIVSEQSVSFAEKYGLKEGDPVEVWLYCMGKGNWASGFTYIGGGSYGEYVWVKDGRGGEHEMPVDDVRPIG